MGTRLGELVERFGGQLAGDANLEVTGIAPLADAGASHISFLSNSKFRAQAAQSGAAAPLSTVAERSGFLNTGRYAEVETLCRQFQARYPKPRI